MVVVGSAYGQQRPIAAIDALWKRKLVERFDHLALAQLQAVRVDVHELRRRRLRLLLREVEAADVFCAVRDARGLEGGAASKRQRNERFSTCDRRPQVGQPGVHGRCALRKLGKLLVPHRRAGFGHKGLPDVVAVQRKLLLDLHIQKRSSFGQKRSRFRRCARRHSRMSVSLPV